MRRDELRLVGFGYAEGGQAEEEEAAGGLQLGPPPGAWDRAN